MDYVDIEKALIPYRFDVTIIDETFTVEVHYNPDYDFFSVDLEKNGEVLAVGEKLIYGQQLFGDVLDNRFPKLAMIPYDESGKQHEVNWQTLSESVFLYLVDGSEDDVGG